MQSTLPDTTLAHIVSLLATKERARFKPVWHRLLTATCTTIAWQYEASDDLFELTSDITSLRALLGCARVRVESSFPLTRLAELSLLHASLHELDLSEIQLYAPHVIDTLLKLVTMTADNNNTSTTHQPLRLQTLHIHAQETCHLTKCASKY